MLPPGGGAGALEQLRQQREDATAGSRGSPGGSPADRPTSRWAMATRVTLSITAGRRSPWSRNHSAIRVAVKAARRRTSGGLVGGGDDHDGAGQALGAEVVARGTRGPRGRARRPGRAREIGGVGAADDHRQQCSTCRRPSRRRCRCAGPVRRAPACRGRARRGPAGCRSGPGSWRSGRRSSTPVAYDVAQRRAAVDRAPQARRRPARAGRAPTGTVSGPPVATTRLPRRTPRRSETGMQVAASPCRATTSARIGPVSPVDARPASPTPRSSPATSTLRPTARGHPTGDGGGRGVQQPRGVPGREHAPRGTRHGPAPPGRRSSAGRAGRRRSRSPASATQPPALDRGVGDDATTCRRAARSRVRQGRDVVGVDAAR